MADKAISSEAKLACECCKKIKTCRMYVLQNGEAAWVCIECREGKS